MELREKIAELISPWMEDREYLAAGVADEVLDIPEIAEALLLMRMAQMRFCETMRPASPEEMLLGQYQSAHPWANLLKPEDLTESPPTDDATE